MLQFDPKDMDMPHFVIKYTMPGLNQYLSECGRNPHAGAKIKRDNMMLAANAIRRYLRRYKAKNAIIVHFHYYYKDRRMDKDNIDSFCRKCVFDALQKCGVIENDGWNQIENYTHDFFVDAKNPRIEVWLEEIQ